MLSIMPYTILLFYQFMAQIKKMQLRQDNGEIEGLSEEERQEVGGFSCTFICSTSNCNHYLDCYHSSKFREG